jgi:A/G-specific adenine glycosylase
VNQDLAGIDVRRFADRLKRWYRAHHRDLPWRRTRDPYAIWVSEIMLQQTTVEAVLPHYQRFLARFPDVRALARAPRDDVLHAWSGLGYYRRATHLHAAAQVVCERHDGTFPHELDDALALPGIGRYTAGAILSFAYDRRLPLVDANVSRVLARVFAIEHTLGSTAATRELWQSATALVPAADPATHNQALMELGARVCTPAQPSCLLCPVRPDCRAHATGRTHDLPRLPARRASERVAMVAALLTTTRERILFHRRPPTARLAGQWELPTRELRDDPLATLAHHFPTIPPTHWTLRGSLRHTILHHHITLTLYAAQLPRPLPPTSPDTQWLTAAQRQTLPLTTLTRKALRM